MPQDSVQLATPPAGAAMSPLSPVERTGLAATTSWPRSLGKTGGPRGQLAGTGGCHGAFQEACVGRQTPCPHVPRGGRTGV